MKRDAIAVDVATADLSKKSAVHKTLEHSEGVMQNSAQT
jgi:hypothetical protein